MQPASYGESTYKRDACIGDGRVQLRWTPHAETIESDKHSLLELAALIIREKSEVVLEQYIASWQPTPRYYVTSQ